MWDMDGPAVWLHDSGDTPWEMGNQSHRAADGESRGTPALHSWQVLYHAPYLPQVGLQDQ